MGYEFNDSELCMCDRCRDFFPADEMYQLKDGQPVTSAQVYAVIMRNSQVFCKAEGRIMLLM